MRAANLIAIDWGTSSFRAWAMTDDGTVVDEVSSPNGILAVPDGDFEGVFEAAVGAWLDANPDLPVIASGMITSRNGWCETPYLPLPVAAGNLARALRPFTTRKGRTIQFVTGAARNPETGLPDVIRGEETELVGHLAAGGSGQGLFVMPGTHSKWARAEGGALIDFETYMTGEIFAVLSKHSILGRLMAADAPPANDSFRRGVEVARNARSSITSTLFSARSLALFDRLAPTEIADYLSGLLIGEEVRSGVATHSGITEVTVVGRGDLADRFAMALDLFGVSVSKAEPGMARLGLLEIGKRAGLVST
ncbi:MAG: 2-dehydro-3-deoxygalactonokinase [Alphaproteobacteria bacterium]|nr:2-dehydro-3-deoxygalactonokinase [Alphaproteobacteria bacterium]